MRKILILGALLLSMGCYAQEEEGKGVTFHGSVQSDWLVPQDDSNIGTEHSKDAVLTNTYVDLMMQSRYVDAGARLEYLQHPLQGFEKEFKGWGVPNVYVKGKIKGADMTVGSFYEQFGSGFILRTYEERSLGIDNSLNGARIHVDAVKGLNIKALAGVQRRYWDWDMENWVYGADAELNLDAYSHRMQEKGLVWLLGGSWVGKHEPDENVLVSGTNYRLHLPRNVNSFDARTQLQKGGFGLLAEYAWKDMDPGYDNGYTYHRGNAAMLSASYSRKGLSALVQAKRSENMAYRSHRSVNGISAFINNMPTFTYDHTYSLAALYPYATQYGTASVPGEWAFQAEAAYSNFPWNKKKVGRKYASKVKANFSHARGIDFEPLVSDLGVTMGSDGYKTSFFDMSSDKYYQDVNLQLDQKLGKQWKLNLMYSRQFYNQDIVEGHGGVIKSNIYVGEAKWTINKKLTLRAEAQYLDVANGHESGNWVYGLVELSVLPYFMFTVSDQYGRPYVDGVYQDKQHYYNASVTFNHGSHRLLVGYGRTRAGFNCSGGVCRWVPASCGVNASYNYTF